MDTGYRIQPKQRIWDKPKQRILIQDMGYNLYKGYGYRI